MRTFGPWAIRVTTRAVADTHYRSQYLDKIFHNLGRKRPEWYANLPEDIRDYTEKNLAASRNYRFEGSYRNKILLFRTCEDTHPLRCISAEDYGWGTITGASVDVVVVPS